MERFSLKRLSSEGNWGGLLLLDTLEHMLRKALNTGMSLYRGFVGEPEVDSLEVTFERKG
jgi:hypothetical protein